SIYAGTTTVHATETKAWATATLTNTAVGGLTVSVYDAEATVSRATEAFIGHHADLHLGTASVTLSAQTPNTKATASTSSKGGGLASVEIFSAVATIGEDAVGQAPAVGAAASGTLVTANRRGVTRSFVDHNAVVVAGAVTLDSDATVTADSTVEMFSIALFAGVKAGKTTATAAQDVESFIGDDAVLTLSGVLTLDADAVLIAIPNIEDFGLAAGVEVSAFTIKAHLDGDVVVAIGNGAEVTATGLVATASANNAPNASVNTSGFAGVVTVTVTTAEAKDSTRVEARIGPSGVGSAVNRTKVTVTGSILLTAALDSSVTANSNLAKIALGGAVGVINNVANQNGVVTARIGEHADIRAGSAGISIGADYDGITKATSTAFTAALGFSAGVTDGAANHTASVSSLVGTGASLTTTGGGGIAIATTHNNDQDTDGDQVIEEGAIASADNMSFSLIVSGSSSTITATANVTATTDVAAGASFNAPGGAITVTTTSRNIAFAALQSISAAIVRVDSGTATPVATGTTTTTFRGSVGTLGTAGASSLVVSASALTAALGTLMAAGGGLVSVGVGNVTSSASPTLYTNFGAPTAVVNVTGKIDIVGSQQTDSDAVSRNTTGGAIEINDYDTTVTATANITVTVDATSKVISGGTLTVRAEHGGDTAPVSDGTILSADGATDIITLTYAGGAVGAPHGLNTGETITYRGSCCSLGDGRTYGVLVTSDVAIRLGAQFLGTRVDPATDIIEFGQFVGAVFQPAAHNLITGDIVTYISDSGSAIGGLTSGTKYKVFVVDATHLKLLPQTDSVISVSVNGATGVDDPNNEIDASNTFGEGTPVTYHAPVDYTFSSPLVDVVVDGLGRLVMVGPADNRSIQTADNNAIYLGTYGPDNNNDGIPDSITGHAYNTGDQIYYDALAGGAEIVGLNTGSYYVIKYNDWQIRLADSFCHAVGTCVDDNGTPGAGDDFIIPQQIEAISSASDASVTHTLVAYSRRPIGGLNNGQVYFTKNRTTTTFQLSSTLGGGALGLSDSGGNGHVFAYEGLDLTSAGTGSKSLRLDISSGSGGQFEGVGGAKAFAVPTFGDGRVTSSTTGVSGGFIEIGSPDASATVTVNTNLVINGGANLNAQDIVIETDSRLDVKATSDSDGVGFVSVADASATATGTNNSALTIHDNAILTALDSLTVRGQTQSDVAASASSDKTGFF
ncbi:MAG: hypothetical protein WAS07_11935, partial [Micropruina sp.]